MNAEEYIHVTADGLYSFDWKPRGGRGFNRTLDNVVRNYYFQLGCDRGGEAYWQEVIADATARDIRGQHQPYQYCVLMTQVASQSVVGFCLLRRGKTCQYQEGSRVPLCQYPEQSWYVEFICTARGQGHGRAFMNELHRRAADLGIEYITLSALPEVIMFYHAAGYKLTLNLNCLESPEIAQVAHRVREEIRRRKTAGERIPSNVDEMLQDPLFNELLLVSIRDNLSSARLRGDACAETRDCAEDGMYMLICIPQRHMEVVPNPDGVVAARAASLREFFERLPVPKKSRPLEEDLEFMRDMEQ